MSSNRMGRGKASRVLCVLAVGAALAAAGAARGDDPKPPAKGDDAVQKLLRARLEAAQDSYNFRLEQYRAGRLDIAQLEGAARRLFTAELELLDKKEDRVSACQKNLERASRHGQGACRDPEQGRSRRRRGGRGRGIRPSGRRDPAGEGEGPVSGIRRPVPQPPGARQEPTSEGLAASAATGRCSPTGSDVRPSGARRDRRARGGWPLPASSASAGEGHAAVNRSESERKATFSAAAGRSRGSRPAASNSSTADGSGAPALKAASPMIRPAAAVGCTPSQKR